MLLGRVRHQTKLFMEIKAWYFDVFGADDWKGENVVACYFGDTVLGNFDVISEESDAIWSANNSKLGS